MSHLTHLRLSHFRSYTQATLDLSAGPIVLFGANGAGKTNLLEAVSMLSPGRGLRRAKIEDMAAQPAALGWKLTATLATAQGLSEVETQFTDGPRTLRIDGKTAPQIALAKLARMVWLVPVMDRLWVDGAEGRRRFLDRIAMSFTPHHAQTVLTYEKAMRERNRMLKDQITDPAWYRAVEAQMAEAGAEITQTREAALARITAAQEASETSFPSATLTRQGPEGPASPDDAEILATQLTESRARDLAAGRSLQGPHRDDLHAVYTAKDTDARLCSTGEQKALLVSLILSNARALAEDIGAPPILLLDEVAAHLDQNRQAALYDEILALGAQAWMTGTGAELFTPLKTRAQWIEVSDQGTGTALIPSS